MNKWLKAASRRNELMVSTPQLEPATTEQAPEAWTRASGGGATLFAITSLMLAAGLALSLWVGSHHERGSEHSWWVPVVLFVLFVAAERIVFHVEFAHDTKSVSTATRPIASKTE